MCLFLALHSVNCRTLKLKFFCAHSLPKSRLLLSVSPIRERTGNTTLWHQSSAGMAVLVHRVGCRREHTKLYARLPPEWALGDNVLCLLSSSVWRMCWSSIRGGNPPEKKSTRKKEVHLNTFFLEQLLWVTDLCHREEGKHSRELFEKVRVKAVFFWYISGFWVGFWASILVTNIKAIFPG